MAPTQNEGGINHSSIACIKVQGLCLVVLAEYGALASNSDDAGWPADSLTTRYARVGAIACVSAISAGLGRCEELSVQRPLLWGFAGRIRPSAFRLRAGQGIVGWVLVYLIEILT